MPYKVNHKNLVSIFSFTEDRIKQMFSAIFPLPGRQGEEIKKSEK
ncbi:hypothetical protein [Methanosarcina sp.]